MDKDKKILTNIDEFDKLLSNGLTKENLLIFIGESKVGKTRIVFDLETESPYFSRIYSKEMADKVTEKGQCVMFDMVEKLKENGFDTSMIKMSKTRYEKFGNTVFPVTYSPNGIVIVDYPNEPFMKNNDIIQDK